MRSGAVDSALGQVTAGLDTLAATDLATADDHRLREQLLELVTVSNRVHAELVRHVDFFDSRGLSAPDGFRTPKAWLQGFGRLSGAMAHRLVKAARLLRRLPKLAEATQTGQVSAEHVQLVSRLADRVGVEQLGEVDATLADAAGSLDAGRFGTVCARVQAHLDPDGPDPGKDFEKRSLTLSPLRGNVVLRGQLDGEGGATLATALDAIMTPPAEGDERTAAQRRADALTELARRALTTGELPTVGGQRPQVGVLLFPQSLSPKTLATLAELHRGDAAGPRLREWLARTYPDGPPPAGGPDPAAATSAEAAGSGRATARSPEDMVWPDQTEDPDGFRTTPAAAGPTPEQADAAEPPDRRAEPPPARQAPPPRLCREHHGHGGPEPAPAGPKPGSIPSESSDAGSPSDEGVRAVLRPTWSQSGWADPPWLNWIGPISPVVAQRIACDADIWRIIIDPHTGMPLDVGRAYRLVPYWIRKALWARDRGCRWHGCDTPAEWTDAHHLDPFAEGGQTEVERCVMLCRYHHGLVHEGGWSIDLDPQTGEVSITRPSGLPYRIPQTRSTAWNGPTSQLA